MAGKDVYKLMDIYLQTVNLINLRAKKPHSYGTKHKIYQSEIHTLGFIIKNPNTNAGQLAELIGVTNGALTQVVLKLTNKGLITSYNVAENKKEVYYHPTRLGIKANEYHNEYDEKLLNEDFGFLKDKSKDEINLIIDFFEKVREGLK